MIRLRSMKMYPIEQEFIDAALQAGFYTLDYIVKVKDDEDALTSKIKTMYSRLSDNCVVVELVDVTNNKFIKVGFESSCYYIPEVINGTLQFLKITDSLESYLCRIIHVRRRGD